MPANAQAKLAGHDQNSVAINAKLTANGRTERAQDADPLQALASEVEAAVLHVDSSADAQVPEVLLLLLLPCNAQAAHELMHLEWSSLEGCKGGGVSEVPHLVYAIALGGTCR